MHRTTPWLLLVVISSPLMGAHAQATDYLTARGDAARDAGDAATALAAFNAALRERPDDAEPLRRRGRALREQRRLDEALAAYSRAIEVDSAEGAARGGQGGRCPARPRGSPRADGRAVDWVVRPAAGVYVLTVRISVDAIA